MVNMLTIIPPYADLLMVDMTAIVHMVEIITPYADLLMVCMALSIYVADHPSLCCSPHG